MLLQEDFLWYFLPPLTGTQTRFLPVSSFSGIVMEGDLLSVCCCEGFLELVLEVLFESSSVVGFDVPASSLF